MMMARETESRHVPRPLHELRALLPPLNFITVHYAYFVVVILLTSVIFWGSSNPSHSISYPDSLFLVVSAMTEAGLNTVNLSQMTTWQQTILFLLILFGGAIWVSIWTVAFRLHVFEKRFRDIVEAEKARRPSSRGSGSPFFRMPSFGKAATAPAGGGGSDSSTLPGMGSKLVTNAASSQHPDATSVTLPPRRRTASLSYPLPGEQATEGDEKPDGHASEHRDPAPTPQAHITFSEAATTPRGARDATTTTTGSAYANARRPRRRNADNSASDGGGDTSNSDMHSILTDKTGRNAQFHHLTKEEREQLGGCEYRALRLLALVVPLYFALWQFLGCVSLGAWIAHNKPEVATANGLSPWWTGVFFGVSAFNNSGMALLDANVIPFQDSYFVLIVMGAMILAGNTAYPIMLRFIFWSMAKVLSFTTHEQSYRDFKATLQLILRYPRRVYTNMFPARQTWWLLFMVCLLNMVDWVGFEILNLGNPNIEAIPLGPRIIDGLFQAIGTFYEYPTQS